MTNEIDRISKTPEEYIADADARFQNEVGTDYLLADKKRALEAIENRQHKGRKELFHTTQVGSVPHEIVNRREEASRGVRLRRAGRLIGKTAAATAALTVLVQSNGGVHDVAHNAETLPAHIASLFTGPEASADTHK